MKRSKQPRRDYCSGCGRLFALKPDGTLWDHYGPSGVTNASGYGLIGRCRGARKRPDPAAHEGVTFTVDSLAAAIDDVEANHPLNVMNNGQYAAAIIKAAKGGRE